MHDVVLIVILTWIVIIFGTILYFGLFAIVDWLGDAGFILQKPIEGVFLYIMKGGSLKKIIYSVKGWHLNEDGKMVKITGKPPKEGFLRRWFGVELIGNPFACTVLSFELSWIDPLIETGGQGYAIVPHVDETVTGLSFQRTYTLLVERAETRGQIPLNVVAELTIRRTFPERAAFKLSTPATGLNTVRGLVLSQIREVIQSLKIDQVLGLGDNTESDLEDVKGRIVKAVYKLNTNANFADVDLDLAPGEKVGALSTLTGYEIVNLSIKSIEPDLTKEQLEKLQAVPLARKQAEAAIILAEGDKQAAILRGEGEAGALKSVATVMHQDPSAAELRRLKTIEASKLVTLGNSGMKLLVQTSTEKTDGTNGG